MHDDIDQKNPDAETVKRGWGGGGAWGGGREGNGGGKKQ